MVERPNIVATSEKAQNKILCFLHYRYAHSENIVFTKKELNGLFEGITDRILDFSIGELDNSIYISHELVEEDGQVVRGYLITNEGIKLVDSWDNETYQEVAEGIDFLESEGSTSVDVGDSLENAWSPLPIDRNTEEYKKATESLEDAINKIESDNGYSANAPEERDSVVWALKEGLQFIKELSPSKEQIQALLIQPLNRAIATLKDSVPGLAAMVAREAIKEWIKSLFR